MMGDWVFRQFFCGGRGRFFAFDPIQRHRRGKWRSMLFSRDPAARNEAQRSVGSWDGTALTGTPPVYPSQSRKRGALGLVDGGVVIHSGGQRARVG